MQLHNFWARIWPPSPLAPANEGGTALYFNELQGLQLLN